MSEPQGDGDYRAPDLTLLGDDHIRAYRETNGEVGHIWNGATSLLLTTTGIGRSVRLWYTS